MKKIFWSVIVLLFLGFIAYKVIQTKEEAETKRIEEDRIEQETKSAVNEMVRRHNAITDWPKELSKGNSYRISPVLTVELEKLWVNKRPILFIGTINDVSGQAKEKYNVVIARSLFNSIGNMLSTELRLSLKCEKDKVDSLLNKNPNIFNGFGFNTDVAVIAKINSIETKELLGPEGESATIKLGRGECVELYYIGSTQIQ